MYQTQNETRKEPLLELLIDFAKLGLVLSRSLANEDIINNNLLFKISRLWSMSVGYFKKFHISKSVEKWFIFQLVFPTSASKIKYLKRHNMVKNQFGKSPGCF